MSTRRAFDHSGSSFDSFLEEEGILDEVEAAAIKRVIAWQLAEAMKVGCPRSGFSDLGSTTG